MYIAASTFALIRRQRTLGVAGSRGWYALATVVSGSALVAGLLTLLDGEIAWFELALLFLLARPMVALVFVLASLRTES